MKAILESQLEPQTVIQALRHFWSDTLEVEKNEAGGAVLAYPLNYPDGWQIVLELSQTTPRAAVLSDGGRTLRRLAEAGQIFDSRSRGTYDLLQERLNAFEVSRNGLELWRTIAMPLQGIDIHVFAEALVSIAYLYYRHEPEIETENVADRTVEKVIFDRRLAVTRGAKLDGTIERQVTVDFLVKTRSPVAVQLITRRGNVLPYMEQWGFRWNDLRSTHLNLLPVMIYDPARQTIDATSREIGKRYCELFCPYHETEQLHQLLDRAQER